jgi:multiple sugar transport system substrate-binding protein
MRRSLLKVAVIAVLMCGMIASIMADPVLVRYSRWAGGAEETAFKALVEKFNSSVGVQKNIKVVFEPLPWSAYWDKLKTTVLAGDAPDVISLSNAGENGSYLTRGVFLNLSKMPDAGAVIGGLAKPAVDSLTVNKNVLGLPVGLGVRAMVYNKKLLKEAGIAYPDPVKPMTWETFLEMAKKLSKKGADGKYTQYTGLFSMTEFTDSIVAEMGGKILDDRNHPTKVMINNPVGIAALKFVQDLHKNSVLPPDTGEWQTAFGTPDNAVATGKTVFMLSGPWGFDNFKSADSVVKADDVGTCPFPVFKGKENLRATRGYINGLAIYRKSKVTKEAWEFVKWLVGKEGQLEFTKTGDLPANISALAQAQANADKIYTSTSPENYKAYFSDLPFVISGPTLPTGEWTALEQNTELDLRKGVLTPEAAAKKLEKDGNETLTAMWE